MRTIKIEIRTKTKNGYLVRTDVYKTEEDAILGLCNSLGILTKVSKHKLTIG